MRRRQPARPLAADRSGVPASGIRHKYRAAGPACLKTAGAPACAVAGTSRGGIMTGAVDIGLLILRCAVAAVCLAHGVNHIFGGGKIAGPARWFTSLGMKPGIVHAWVASLTEIGSGLLLGLGF